MNQESTLIGHLQALSHYIVVKCKQIINIVPVKLIYHSMYNSGDSLIIFNNNFSQLARVHTKESTTRSKTPLTFSENR